jgi:hypothetical protein
MICQHRKYQVLITREAVKYIFVLSSALLNNDRLITPNQAQTCQVLKLSEELAIG